jgi:hypothetical protein
MANNKSNKLTESKIWKDTIGALLKMWDGYLEFIASQFHGMSRFEQEELITKYSWIVSMGGVGLIWCQVYNFVPPPLRLIGAPLSLAFAYWFGRTVVSRVMIDRMNKYLK